MVRLLTIVFAAEAEDPVSEQVQVVVFLKYWPVEDQMIVVLV